MSLTYSSSNGNSNSGTPPGPPRKMRSLDDLYEVTNPIDDIKLYCHLATFNPIVFEEAIKDIKWRITMDEEIALIEKNDTCRLVPRPKRKKKPIDFKWIYKEKKNVKGKIESYRARSVAKGYSQKHEIKYDEVVALVTRLETIHLIIVIDAQNKWRIYQIDVKSTLMVLLRRRSTLRNL